MLTVNLVVYVHISVQVNISVQW